MYRSIMLVILGIVIAITGFAIVENIIPTWLGVTTVIAGFIITWLSED
jgi:hypothetical protein